MKTINHLYTLLRPYLALVFLLLAIFSISRLALLLWLQQRIGDINTTQLFLGGLRIDISTSVYLSVPVLVVVLLSSIVGNSVLHRINRFSSIYSAFVVTLVVLMELATPAFINQYDVRPNRLFIEYLAYPHEVFSMLVNGHLATLVVSVVLAAAAFVIAKQFFTRTARNTQESRSLFSASLLFLLVLPLVALAARGTLGHRPINPALVYFSQDALVNSLTLNSLYSVAFAFKNMSSEQGAQQLYGTMDENEIIDVVKQESYKASFVSEQIPTLATNTPFNQGPKKNLVIILEESLGARFVGALGGAGLTPHIDKLYEQGWGFDNLYATGTRSVRGIEAVMTGFLPSPSRSVVKLSKSQQHFSTIAQILANQGYTTQFVYGGESHFDNMKSFFLGNGVQHIVDFDDIEDPQFVSSWGASDVDLFRQADKELVKLNAQGKPFFSLIFTSSNHDPFEIPQDSVELPQGFSSDYPARDKAIMYADKALGEFIGKAKNQAYWQNTVFLVVADHDVRVYGKEPVPIKSFHIPAVILNAGVQKRDERLVSQIDLPVTLLSLVGVDAPTPMTGLDLTKEYPVERAMMQYYDNFAYIENDAASILMPGNKASYWHYDKQAQEQREIVEDNHMKELRHKALAHVLFSSFAYQQQLYRLEN